MTAYTSNPLYINLGLDCQRAVNDPSSRLRHCPRPPLKAKEKRPHPSRLEITSMPLRLDSESPDFESRFKALLATKREVSEDVDATVRDIVRRRCAPMATRR